ncbi:uncharacterized protein PgNI_12474 [Pyricularia grisea]|uniref:Uncharacterized protein n=1 Tax=Pyricularia grisea TaxID=148305 RepID=A0A6P8AMI4_PYRGI|nr:uncharacterized protein PgNI_12474 [Pyricularia grisea]TLD03255.1 hypothetical protein PgNI_12474 [Pyricularia grisea]
MIATATFAGMPQYGLLTSFIFCAFVVYRLGLVIYRLYFHPFAKIPGPKLWAVSSVPFYYRSKVEGSFHKQVLEAHKRYGPTVRIAPDYLAMDGAIAYKEVHARRPNQLEFGKYPPWYGLPRNVGIVASHREDHRRLRRGVSHAFSEVALREQEPLIQGYISLLMDRLTAYAEKGEPVDFTRWFNFLTFDVIGDLAFADPFHALHNSDYHPWISSIFAGFRGRALMQVFVYYPLLRPLAGILFRSEIKAIKDETALSVAKAEKRIELGADAPRKDFMTYILRNQGKSDDKTGITQEELLLMGGSLIRAGSETTSTALVGTLFILCKNPRARQLLYQEIRSAFSSESDITMVSTSQLPFLHACIEEGLRLYPPVGYVPPRVSPGDYAEGLYMPKGSQVYVCAWATQRLASNFADPETFAPQRWLPKSHPLYENKFADDNFAAFKPFSYGTRDCIGKNLAYAEMRVTLARLFWKFDLELVPGQDDWMDSQPNTSVWHKNDLMVKLKPVAR